MKICPTCQRSYPGSYTNCPADGALLTQSDQWSEGTVVRGKYRIVRKIGQGAMGSVFKVLHIPFRELRALKVMASELAGDGAFIKRFHHEAVFTRMLHHPNAVLVEDVDETEDGQPFIVMEYIDGRRLRDLMSEGPLASERVCSLIKQIASALEAAHRLGIVHRDIKPQNVMIVDSPIGEVAKVLDFGIARIKDGLNATTAMSLSHTGLVVGTPPYMSPEQAKGVSGDKLDGRSDIYSLGVLMYEMLVGELPIKGETPMQFFIAHVQTPPAPISNVRPDLQIPQTVANIAMKCLAKKPEERFQTCQALIAALESCQLEAARSESERPLVTVGSQFARPTGERNKSTIGTEAVPLAEKGVAHRAEPGAQLPSLVKHTVKLTVLKLPRLGWLILAGCILVSGALSLGISSVRDSLFHFLFGRVSAAAGIPALEQSKDVIVLPTDVRGDPKTIGYLAAGLDEELFRRLSALPISKVVSASTAEEQARVQKVNLKGSAEKIARNFGINLIVHGTVQEERGFTNISVTLDSVPDSRRLWVSKPFSYPDPAVAMHLLDLQNDVYRSMVRVLKLKPNSQERAQAATPTGSIDAYDHYLEGRYALSHHAGPGGIHSAIRSYQSAINEDPGFALAYVGLSDAYLAMYKETTATSWIGKALESAQQAQKLDDNLCEAHLDLGDAYQKLGKTPDAVAEFDRAMQLSPRSDVPWLRLGRTYEAADKRDQAIDAYMKATQLNPYSLVDRNELGAAYFNFSEYDNALVQFRSVTDLDSSNYFGYMNTGDVYLAQGKYGESIQELQKALEVAGDARDEAAIHSNLGTAFFYLQDYARSKREDEEAVRIRPGNYELVGNLADAYRGSGDSKKAMDSYETAIEMAKKQLDMNPKNADVLGDVALYYAKKGNLTQAADDIRDARLIDPYNANLIFYEATIYMIAQQPRLAIESLRMAFEKGYSPKLARVDPEFRSLWGNPDFQKLVGEYSTTSN